MAEELIVHDRSRDALSIEIRMQKLDRALGWIHRNIAAYLDMAALAQLSNMKAPAMCRRFLISFGMTPIQYQRRVRMQEVRRLLLIERLDLAAVRLRVGYHRPLEFVRDYRRRYAILPMEDVETGLGVGGCEVHRWALPASLLVSPIAHEG